MKRMYASAAAVAIAGGLIWVFWPQAQSVSRDSRDERTSSTAAPGSAPTPGQQGTGHPRGVRSMETGHPGKVAQPSAAFTYRPMPPINTPLRTSYGELKQQADAGNPVAQCRLAFELERCRKLPQRIRSAEEFAKREERRPEVSAKPLLQLLQREIATSAPVCQDFTPSASDEPWRYTLYAALNGNDAAALSFVLAMSAGLDPGKPVAAIDGWQAYRDYAPRFLQRAIDNGNPAAYYMAANFTGRTPYGATLVPNDPVQAAAYYLALMPSASPLFRNELQENVQRLNLSAGELAQAQARAAPLMARVRVTSGGALDLSTGILNEGKPPDGSECEK